MRVAGPVKPNKQLNRLLYDMVSVDESSSAPRINQVQPGRGEPLRSVRNTKHGRRRKIVVRCLKRHRAVMKNLMRRSGKIVGNEGPVKKCSVAQKTEVQDMNLSRQETFAALCNVY